MPDWKKSLACLGFIAIFILGGIVGAFITQRFYSQTSEKPLRTGAQQSLKIEQFIDKVKTALDEAQKKYIEEQKGPPFLVKDFDLEVHVELAESQKVEGGGQIPNLSLQVASSKSSGITHLVKLHFESALYDIAKQVIEDCARNHLPSIDLPILSMPLQAPLEQDENPLQLKEFIEKLGKAEKGFFDCINGRLPPDAMPLSSIISSLLQALFPLKEKLQ